MLQDYKISYQNQADVIQNWKNMNLTELCNLYIECDNNTLKNGYISAIIVKCWSMIMKTFRSRESDNVNDFDCYDNTISSILYVLKMKPWLNPNSSLYSDPKGPEKALNIVLKSRRSNIYQANHRMKRVIHNNTVSYDGIAEYSEFGEVDKEIDDDLFISMYISTLVSNAFKRYEYTKMFIVDAMVNGNILDFENKFDIRKMRHHIRNISDYYLHVFAKNYNIDYDSILYAYDKIKNIDQEELDNRISRAIIDLKHDDNIRNMLGID